MLLELTVSVSHMDVKKELFTIEVKILFNQEEQDLFKSTYIFNLCGF